MAKCEKRELKPEPPPVEYVLTLTQHEKDVLEKVLWLRPVIDHDTTAGQIYRALQGAGGTGK